MRLSELSLNKVCHEGDCAFFFTINTRFRGNTRDKVMYHVYDDQTNAFTSYLGPELDAKLQQGYFENVLVTTNNNTPVISETSNSGWGTQEYIFTGIGVAALIGLAAWGSKN